MQIVRITGVGRDYDYQWPAGAERYRYWVEYEARDAYATHHIRVGYGTRHAYGEDRERVVVWVDGRPAVEFAGADDFETTGEVVTVLKVPNESGPGERNVAFPDDPVPERYLLFAPVRHRSRIDGPRAPHAWGVVINVSDHHRFAAFAALRNLERVTPHE